MRKILGYASKQLASLQPPLPPHRRIFLCHQYSLKPSVWFYPAVVELLEQVEPLNMDEAKQVGLELFQKIAMIREDLRPYRNENGKFPFTHDALASYASSRLQGGPKQTLVAPLSVHRRITD
jgi:hypothetical protein